MTLLLLSPRTWGCTGRASSVQAVASVVPTHVGVYRGRSRGSSGWSCCPHARGGVPIVRTRKAPRPRLSPRTWGCTEHGRVVHCGELVVPTHVGVYRSRRSPPSVARCRPHARGGVPPNEYRHVFTPRLSPRTWGCTVVQDRSRNGRYRCPHARGGVPRSPLAWESPARLSPRTWGCTGSYRGRALSPHVVPTHVGVYRTLWRPATSSASCPHARGGVP